MDLFDLTCSFETQDRRYLLSHAGILRGWVGAHEKLLGTSVDIGNRLNELLHDNSYRFPLMMAMADVSSCRGGLDLYGSPVWADVSEHTTDRFEWKDIYQIFGHTWMPEEIITPYWACLDCGRAFVLDIENNRFI